MSLMFVLLFVAATTIVYGGDIGSEYKSANIILNNRMMAPYDSSVSSLAYLASEDTSMVLLGHTPNYAPTPHEKVREALESATRAAHSTMDAFTKSTFLQGNPGPITQSAWKWFRNSVLAHERFATRASTFLERNETTHTCNLAALSVTCANIAASQQVLVHLSTLPGFDPKDATPPLPAPYTLSSVLNHVPVPYECWQSSNTIRQMWYNFHVVHPLTWEQGQEWIKLRDLHDWGDLIWWQASSWWFPQYKTEKWLSTLEYTAGLGTNFDDTLTNLYRMCYHYYPSTSLFHKEAWRAMDQVRHNKMMVHNPRYVSFVTNEVEKHQARLALDASINALGSRPGTGPSR